MDTPEVNDEVNEIEKNEKVMVEQINHMQAILEKFETTHDHIIEKCIELQEENEALKLKVEPDS